MSHMSNLQNILTKRDKTSGTFGHYMDGQTILLINKAPTVHKQRKATKGIKRKVDLKLDKVSYIFSQTGKRMKRWENTGKKRRNFTIRNLLFLSLEAALMLMCYMTTYGRIL